MKRKEVKLSKEEYKRRVDKKDEKRIITGEGTDKENGFISCIKV